MAAVALSASTHPTKRMVTFDTDSVRIGVDNRCTACISNNIDDFVGPMIDTNRVIKGFGGTRTAPLKAGTLLWKWNDDTGSSHTFRIPGSYYVPDGGVRLLSPQHWAQCLRRQGDASAREGTDATSCTLSWNGGKSTRTIDLGREDNVATFRLSEGYRRYELFCHEVGIDSNMCIDLEAMSATEGSQDEEDEASVIPCASEKEIASQWKMGQQVNQPRKITFDFDHGSEMEEEEITKWTTVGLAEGLTDTEHLMRIHRRMGHVSFAKIKEMSKLGIISPRLAHARTPKCAACLYGGATRRAWRGKPRHQDMGETEKPTEPGQRVSVDQLVSPTPGLVAQMTGHLTTKRYLYATVFVDQATGYGYTHLQKTATAEETLEGKAIFEQKAEEVGIRVKAYHADNGVFRAHKWVNDCRRLQQGMTFAGVNAHHQNGVAERRIRSIQEMARSMLMHAQRKWPEAVTANLWPYALRMASMAINAAPSMQDRYRRSLLQKFMRTLAQFNIKHWHHFGIPVYALNRSLQQGKSIHKWSQRATPGIYLGPSPQHGRNVALVLSMTTGLVSPQFHVTFDTEFDTVKDQKWPSMWQVKAGFVANRRTHTSKREGEAIPGRLPKRTAVGGPNPSNTPPGGGPPPEGRQQATQPLPEGDTTGAEAVEQPERENPGRTRTDQPPETQPEQPGPVTVTRSGRQVRPPERLIQVMATEIAELTKGDVGGEIFAYKAICPEGQPINGGKEKTHKCTCHPLTAYKATTDPDTMYFHEAMREPDKIEFVKAMVKEVTDQSDNGNFTVEYRSSVPEGATVLPAVWQMKRKRDIRTRNVKKWKARLNIDGSRMKYGQHYDATYAPVASWNSIRTLLTLTVLHGWKTVQIDYVLAFPQAPVEKELYMSIPKGMDVDCEEGLTKDDYVLKIHRNLYGQKQAGRVWNRYLVSKLQKIGFVQSKIDECVFYRKNVMYVLYTDDSILAGPNQRELDKAIADIKRIGLDITVESDLQDFLGINIDRQEDGTIVMSQPHLIQQILKALRLDGENVGSKPTPAKSSELLSSHTNSQPFDAHFDYRSVIGKLNYLERGTRPDISYIVHQCARFTANPKVEHGQAVKWLGRYLKGTKTKGLIIKPNASRGLEVFVDADFAGNWDRKEATHRDTARSRHGYVVMYAGSPLLWKSQLQGEIALSSTESEYNGLSYSLRDAIPIMELLKEIKGKGMVSTYQTPKIHCKVFEDNSGALEMAKIHKYRPRTKHINVKLHHFRDYVDRGDISIHAIKTDEQPADFLTKPLNEGILVKHRHTVMGW